MHKVVIEVCVGTTCYVMGASDLLLIRDEFTAEENTHIELKGINCLDLCSGKSGTRPPYVLLNGRILHEMNLPALKKEVSEALHGINNP